jgi:hypothetical protein
VRALEQLDLHVVGQLGDEGAGQAGEPLVDSRRPFADHVK